jgi:hypothetical protein
MNKLDKSMNARQKQKWRRMLMHRARASACPYGAFGGKTKSEGGNLSLNRPSRIKIPLTTHLELPALQNIAVSATGLARSAGDSSVETTGAELALKQRVNLRHLLALLEDTLDVAGLLLLLLALSRGLLLRALAGYGLGILFPPGKR